MVKIVGIGDYAVSRSPEETIVTFALASCVAVTAYSPSIKAAGMIHIVLPAPTPNREGSLGPYYYATTGIPLMLNKMCSEYGCLKSELRVRLFGGANSIREKDVFKLGQKNIRMVEKVLKDMKLSYDSSETSGTLSRTLEMNVGTGMVAIKLHPITI